MQFLHLSISILFPHLFSGLPNCLFSSSFPIKPCTPYFLTLPCYMSTHITTLQHRNITNIAHHCLPNYTVYPQITVHQLPHTCCDRGWAGQSIWQCNSAVSELACCQQSHNSCGRVGGGGGSGPRGMMQLGRWTAGRASDRLEGIGKV
jgi:hypothetical protein